MNHGVGGEDVVGGEDGGWEQGTSVQWVKVRRQTINTVIGFY